MYIILSSTKLNYINKAPSDFIILSEIVDSSLSYEKPTLVRSVEQLDIWFGKDFKDRSYLVELLNMGVTLYLYKPVSADVLSDNIDDYIDIDKCTRDNGVYNSVLEIISPIDRYIYTINKTEYIYLKELGDFIQLGDLPQNQLVCNSDSFNNRDTLSIGDNYFLSPKIFNGELVKEKSNSRINISSIDYERLKKGYQTLLLNDTVCLSFVFDYDFGTKEEPQYIILGDTTYYCSPYKFRVLPDITGTKNKVNIVVGTGDLDSRINAFIDGLGSYGYYIDKNSHQLYLTISDSITGKIINLVDYYSALGLVISHNLSGLTLVDNLMDYSSICSLVYNYNKSNELISFYSKTIGTADSMDGNIKVTIEKGSTQDRYKVTLSRYDYVEVFEGTIDGSTTEKSLQELISTQSRLSYCNINVDIGYCECSMIKGVLQWSPIRDEKTLTIEDYKRSYIIYDVGKITVDNKEGDIALYRKPLPLGSWELSGAVKETNTPVNYKKALRSLVNSVDTDTILIDYLLVPNIENFGVNIDNNTGSYSIYQDLLNLSKEIDCQVLIHNTPCEVIRESDGKIKSITGQSEHNYLNDKENRLLYFYDSIWTYGEERPGYYIYLNNLLLNDVYSPSVSNIMYNSPVNDPYLGFLTEGEDIKIENWLRDKKTNYLVTNNQIYYYKEYQNGSSFSMSGWMRFCISKINRELIRNKWMILEDKNVGRMELKVKNILNNIKNSFSMIRDIQVSKFLVDLYNQTVDITIDTYVSDLVNNHLTLDITLNYSKF